MINRLIMRRRPPKKPEPQQRYVLPRINTIETMDCDHVDTPQRVIEQTYGIEAFFPALSEMFSEESVTVRVYASPATRDLLVGLHDDMAQEGRVGTVRIGDVLGNIDVAERMGRDADVNDECNELSYRRNHGA